MKFYCTWSILTTYFTGITKLILHRQFNPILKLLHQCFSILCILLNQLTILTVTVRIIQTTINTSQLQATPQKANSIYLHSLQDVINNPRYKSLHTNNMTAQSWNLAGQYNGHKPDTFHRFTLPVWLETGYSGKIWHSFPQPLIPNTSK
jgi:hypothetical protein